MPRIYTKTGDDGTTGLLFGGRVSKASPAIEVNGAVDEAQSALGVARAETSAGSELHDLLIVLEHDLWVLMAEVATAPTNRHKLVAGRSAVEPAMVAALEDRIDGLLARFEMPAEFVVPGANRVSALLDVARAVVRRAERLAAAHPPDPASLVGPYLNRLSDLLWAAARWQDGAEHLTAREVGTGPGHGGTGAGTGSGRAGTGVGTGAGGSGSTAPGPAGMGSAGGARGGAPIDRDDGGEP